MSHPGASMPQAKTSSWDMLLQPGFLPTPRSASDHSTGMAAKAATLSCPE